MVTHNPSDAVIISVPAKTASLGLLRGIAAQLAIVSNFTLDEIEEARMATDEAATIVAEVCSTEERITATFSTTEKGLDVALAADSFTEPNVDSYAWMILNALVSNLEVDSAGRLSFTLNSSVVEENA